MKKALAVFIGLASILCMLSGCGSRKVSTDQVKEDILAKDSVYQDYGMTVTEYSESRYEGEQQKDREIVEATVTAENDVCEYKCRYKLYYVRYDDGWKLSHCDDEIISTTAKTEPDPDRILEDVREFYRETLAEYDLTEQSFGDVETVVSQGQINAFIPYRAYQVPFTGSNDLVRVDATLAIGYQLNHSKGWVISGGEFGFKGAQTEISCTPTVGPEDAIRQLMEEEGMESYEILSEKDDSGKDYQRMYYVIRGSDTDGSKYATMIYEYEIQCLFREKEGWIADVLYGEKKLVDAILDVRGTWLYDDGTGLNRYEIHVEEMDLDTITLSYDIVMTDYEGDETRYVSSDGPVTMAVKASRVDDYSLSVSLEKNIAGPEGKGAGKYRLWFYNYIEGHEDYEKSGFKLSGCYLKKIG